MSDEDHMRRAIVLARAQLGRTGANPSVGCVIVAGERIVGEGATADGGSPHAEQIALDMAGDQARDATAYVTLEPCAQRSSGAVSCSGRLLEAGIARVVVACSDPSIMAASQGLDRLRVEGIGVETGLLQTEAQGLYTGYQPRQS